MTRKILALTLIATAALSYGCGDSTPTSAEANSIEDTDAPTTHARVGLPGNGTVLNLDW